MIITSLDELGEKRIVAFKQHGFGCVGETLNLYAADFSFLNQVLFSSTEVDSCHF